MTSVLVTHADLPLGRRIVKRLWHDSAVERILGVGEGAVPRAFDGYRVGPTPRLRYEQLDLARQRDVADLFHSRRLRDAEVDAVVAVPRHGATPEGPPSWARLPVRTAEARILLQHALESPSIRSFVALGSAFVYRLDGGHANHLSESSDLDLDPSVAASLRTWIDCDMLYHGEIGSPRLRVVLLRLPTVVASGGYVYLNPSLEGGAGIRLRPTGFDPLCSVVADKDVARAVVLAVHSRRAGVYNVAGRELLPMSQLGRWTRRPCVPVPGPLLRLAATAAQRLRRNEWGDTLDGAHRRFGFSLDTRRAERDLGYRPGYRVGLSRAGDGAMRLETVPAPGP